MEEDDAKQFNDAFNDDPPKDEPPVEQPADPVEPPEEPKTPEAKEEPKPVEEPPEEEKPKEAGEETPPKEPETPETPEAPKEEEPEEAPQPLTKDDVRSIITDLRSEERGSTQEIEAETESVIEAFYPQGLSNTLVDEKTGKEIKTPQDVVELSDNTMTIEEATKWMMNEQFRVDKQVSEIKNSARDIAELNLNFRKGGQRVIEKYQPLFKAYPQVQKKVYDRYTELVKTDKDKGFVLSAPDIEKFYDDFLEPYRMAYEHSQKQAATVPPAEPAKPEPPKPTAQDRMDESGDAGGGGEVDDPNDFAQQVAKELKRGE